MEESSPVAAVFSEAGARHRSPAHILAGLGNAASGKAIAATGTCRLCAGSPNAALYADTLTLTAPGYTSEISRPANSSPAS